MVSHMISKFDRAHFLFFPAIFFLFFLTVLSSVTQADQQESSCRAMVLDIRGVIGPAVADYVDKGFLAAVRENASLIILRMDTPGGLDQAMRDIIKTILSSKIPVASYVAPSGSRAASAGTYILYGSHIAAMAPATNLGAATPIRIGGMPGMPDKEPAKKEDQKNKEKKENDMEGHDAAQKKMVNDAAAYIQSLANRNSRNGKWAQQAVREAVSLTAEEALEKNVVDIIATDLEDLLRQVDGRKVMLEDQQITIVCANATLMTFSPDWRNKLLVVLGNPNIAYILMLLGIYGLIFELANPGHVLPGVIGGIALLFALYSFQILPISYTGLALILLGIVFMIAEVFVPSFGSLGIGGVIAFVFGSFILVDDDSMRISFTLIISTAAVSIAAILWIVGSILVIRKKKIRTGSEALLGSYGEVMEDFSKEGNVWVHGESWRAKSEGSFRKGARVKVVGRDGLKLQVEKMKEEP